MENNAQNSENNAVNAVESLNKTSDDKLQGENLEGQTDKSEVPTEKTFTQTELNDIINKRISKANAKHSEELEEKQRQYEEQINLMELKYKALQDEYKAYKLDIEFQEEHNTLKRLGISKEAINSLKAVKLLGDENTYKVLREALITPMIKGKTPKTSLGNSKGVNPKKVSFLD